LAEWEGQRELQKKLKALGTVLLLETGPALFTEAVEIEQASRKRTPVDTGALRASHETERPVVQRNSVSVTISVGGPAAPYAIKVHEMVEVPHRVGEAKFLEKSVLEAAPGLNARIARRIDLNRVAKK
jgi:hypothetical protein